VALPTASTSVAAISPYALQQPIFLVPLFRAIPTDKLPRLYATATNAKFHQHLPFLATASSDDYVTKHTGLIHNTITSSIHISSSDQHQATISASLSPDGDRTTNKQSTAAEQDAPFFNINMSSKNIHFSNHHNAHDYIG
jgi:hypothetical protein